MTSLEIIINIVSGGLAGALVGFLLNSWLAVRLKADIETGYQKELERYKSDLECKNAVYIAKIEAQHEESKQLLQHNLELARLEHQIQYSGTYQEIMTAIKKIHALLIKIQRSMNAYTNILESSSGPSKAERRQAVSKLVDDFWEMYDEYRIFLKEELDNEIMKYMNTVGQTGLEFMFKVENNKSNYQDWIRIDQEIRSQWDTVLSSIRSQFRRILGVEVLNLLETDPS